MTSAINDYFLYALLGIAIGFVRLFVQSQFTQWALANGNVFVLACVYAGRVASYGKCHRTG